MMLPIKKEYFDKIKSGEKVIEYRDAHITFVCEETGETLCMMVDRASVVESTPFKKAYPNANFEDDELIAFHLTKGDKN